MADVNQPGKTNGDILIVDDTLSNLRILSDMLREQGYAVRGAPNGQTALMIAESEPPDVILLDIVMPGMDGYEVCQRLKSEDKTRDIPVIFLSARSETMDKIKGFEVGGVDYITKPFQLEEVLARVKMHMNLRNLQRHLQEKNAQLQQVNATLHQRTTELELVNQELKDFAYVVSHDLKAPLRGINRLVNWLVEDHTETFDEQGKEMCDLLLDRVKWMDIMIDGILRYSRAGRIIGNKEPIDLNSLVQEVINIITPPESVQVIVEPDLPVVLGDRIHLEQVFQNLVSNAVKFMDKSDGRITIHCVDEGAYWKFSVADNGPGIAPQHHKRIFRIFQTLTSHDERDSTGVGLSIVRKIIEFYGGEIWIDSEVGEGSTFYFTIPKKAEGLL